MYVCTEQLFKFSFSITKVNLLGGKMSFRQVFRLPKKDAVTWFPGHMNKGLRQMQQKLKSIDCIIEVHDARIPISGRNLEFEHRITGSGIKPHILVLNKKDLTDPATHRDITNELRQRQHHNNIIFTNCKQQTCSGIQRILPLASKLVSEGERYNRSADRDYNIMIIGVPNVGKSSLINVLRNRNLKRKSAARVGGEAGVTRSVGEKIKIQEKPAIYMVDTPGIMQPKIEDDETGMKLALVGCLPDHLVGEDLIADYLLYWLNKHQRFEYVETLGLNEPCDEIAKVLATYAQQTQLFRRVKQYNGQVVVMTDLLVAAKKFIQQFRTGKLGHINLDEAPRT